MPQEIDIAIVGAGMQALTLVAHLFQKPWINERTLSDRIVPTLIKPRTALDRKIA